MKDGAKNDDVQGPTVFAEGEADERGHEITHDPLGMIDLLALLPKPALSLQEQHSNT